MNLYNILSIITFFVFMIYVFAGVPWLARHDQLIHISTDEDDNGFFTLLCFIGIGIIIAIIGTIFYQLGGE